MKYIFLPFIIILLSISFSQAQDGKIVTGVVTDTAKVTQPGTSIQIKSDLGDSSSTVTNMDGKFTFPNVKGTKITLYISSLGFVSTIKHFTLTADPKMELPPIILIAEKNELKEVTIVGINPVKFSEDTVDYKVAAYKVRENAPVEDVLKKVPGVDVDANGNVSSGGKSITKVRINGKDFMGGDVQSATKNLPADILESIQVIDDYGDQANLTGVKTGEPNKILNFVIRADKNYGYTIQATAGAGEDMLPAAPGVSDAGRYVGLVNAFDFKGNRQITVLGNLNNTNVNTFSFTGGNGGGGGVGGGGGRGNAGRGGGGAGGGGGAAALPTTANGINNARSLGTNYRDQYGKTVSVYGSYSFSDNTSFIQSSNFQQNNNVIQTTSNTNSEEHDNPINHRFTFNVEWRPDTINYLKVTPGFSYASTNTTESESDQTTRNGVASQSYTETNRSTSTAPTANINVLYNHRFSSKGQNLSLNLSASNTQSNSYDNPIYHYISGIPTAPLNQIVTQDNKTTTLSSTLSYLQPIGKITYLELRYDFNYSNITNDKETDTLSNANTYNNYATLSNNFKYTFLTNKIALNFREVGAKYNYTLGIGVQPGTLDGESLTTGVKTHVNQFNIIPTANYIYNVSRNQSFRVGYNGTSSQPSFSQLQPVIDYTNASYPVQGNPNLKPQFTNSLNLRYSNFGISSGDVFFVNAGYTNANDYVVANQIVYPTRFTAAALAANPALSRLQSTTLTQYLNTSGYYSATGQVNFAKPWQQRRYTVTLSGSVTYANNIGYSSSVDSTGAKTADVKNLDKTLTFAPTAKFRLDITDVIDAEIAGVYSISTNNNSVQSPLYTSNTNIRTFTSSLVGKNYFFKDWTFSYDYRKQFNYGYAASQKVTNPNILNLYAERRFLKNNIATVRFAVYDLFNQNTGYSVSTTGSSVTQSNVNKLGRYYLATLTIRLQKFAGKAPTQNPDRGDRGNRPRIPGQDGGGAGGRGGQGGPPGGFGGGGNGGGGNGGPPTATF
jgi:uncharacterized membrane protein YgcG